MSFDPRPVIEEIDRRGGSLSAQFLSSVLSDVFPPERYQREPEIPPPLPGMAGRADELDHHRTNPPGGQPFNLIPTPPGAGTCCPLCVGVAINGFRTASSVRRPNINELSFILAVPIRRRSSTRPIGTSGSSRTGLTGSTPPRPPCSSTNAPVRG